MTTARTTRQERRQRNADTAAAQFLSKLEAIKFEQERIAKGLAAYVTGTPCPHFGNVGDLASILQRLTDVADQLNKTGEYTPEPAPVAAYSRRWRRDAR